MDRERDLEHLRLLGVFHYAVAALVALGGCFPIIHLVIGIAMVSGELDHGRRGDPPEAVGWLFIAIAVALMAFFWTLAVLVAIAGRKLQAQRSYTYCFVIAAILCLFMPFGTVLGVFTIVVLVRESVKRLFAEPRAT